MNSPTSSSSAFSFSSDNNKRMTTTTPTSTAVDHSPLSTTSSSLLVSQKNAHNSSSPRSNHTMSRHYHHGRLRMLSSMKSRWMILLLNCIAMTGSYYSYDIPAALHQQLTELFSSHNNNNSDDDVEVKFNLLYTVYSLPNVILPFFGGNIVDRFGAAKCMVLFASILLVGQFLFALGSLASSSSSSGSSSSGANWPLMLLGRTVYGIGGENLTVSSSALLARWFAGGGGEMALAFGVTLALSRLGSVANNWASPTVANRASTSDTNTGMGMGSTSSGAHFGTSSSNQGDTSMLVGMWSAGGGASAALMLGVLVNVVVLCAACAAYVVDKRAAKCCAEENRALELLTTSLLEEDENENEEEFIALGGRRGGSNNNNHGSVLTMTNVSPTSDGSAPLPLPSTTQHQQQNTEGEGGGATSVRISDVRHFGTLFWLLTCSCVVVYGCVLPFNNVASGILLERDYFVSPTTTTLSTSTCQLVHPNQCTEGTLVPPNETNPSLNVITGEACPENPHMAPLLPTSLNVTYQQQLYYFPSLSKHDVQCDTPSSAGSNSQPISNTTNTDKNNSDNSDNNNNSNFWSTACTANYCRALHSATEVAGRVMSIPYVISAACSIPLGCLVDYMGQRAVLAALAPMMLVVVHAMLGFSSGVVAGGGGMRIRIPPEVPLAMQGVAYALYASVIWPSVPLTLPSSSSGAQKWTGTAYGVITSAQNVGLAVFPLVIAWIYDASGQRYLPFVEVFFVGLASLGVCLGVWLHVLDGRMGGRLNGTCHASRRSNQSPSRRTWWRRRRFSCAVSCCCCCRRRQGGVHAVESGEDYDHESVISHLAAQGDYI